MASRPPLPQHEPNWNSHEMQQRLPKDGFQKLHSNDPSRSNTPDPNYIPNQPYYGQPPQQPIYISNGVPVPVTMIQRVPPPPLTLKRCLLGPVRLPLFSYVSAIAMVAAFIYEFVHYHNLTGNIIETKPFNPMIGPSFQTLVNIGARFTPCIRPVPSLPSSTLIGNCYQSETDTCTIQELCGFDSIPDQAYRLVLPMFLHGGVIHILINMLTHLRLGVDLERMLGTPRYILLYMASGIWGFILSAMLSQNLTASTGCSGALFGLIGYMFVDIIVNWKVLPHPIRDMVSLLLSIIISLVLGLLPGLDNFAHIGGFVVGLLMGMFLAPMRPNVTKKGKIITWILRFVALALLVILFAVSIREFYSAEDPSKICPDCKYLSCLPVNNWCDPI